MTAPMKPLLTLIRSIWLVALFVALGLPVIASAALLSPVLFAYDGSSQARMTYDGAAPSASNYDPIAVSTRGGQESRTARTGDIAGKSVEFLAAKAPPGSYRPPSPLPRGSNGGMLPSSSAPHTQLGTEVGRKVGPYTTAREFGENGEWIKDIHFTDHGRPNIPGHVNPHQHPAVPNPTGGTPGYGPAEPFVP